MSAAEIIEQIKALPKTEREIVRHFLVTDQPLPAATTPDFETAANRVFAKHDRILRELAK